MFFIVCSTHGCDKDSPWERLMSFGRKLRELRERRGLSQSELAKSLKVTRNAISNWEAGANHPSAQHIRQIAKILGVQTDVLEGEIPGRIDDDKRPEILEQARRQFTAVGYEQTPLKVVAAAATVTEAELQRYFPDKEALLNELVARQRDALLDALRRTPPQYGSVQARLKQLFRLLALHDLEALRIVSAHHARSWTWDETEERRQTREMSDVADTMNKLFEEAHAQGQIKAAEFRSLTQMLLSVYAGTLRKARFSNTTADGLVSQLEPAIAIVMAGLEFRLVPGFSDSEPTV
jgi:transcriptional regulator with XRE-family HTH domain